MSETYAYHFDEAVVAVPAGFEDRSVQVLEWKKGSADLPIVLCVSRRPLSLPFDEAVRIDIDQTRAGLKACALEKSAPGQVGEVAAHYLALRYVRDTQAIYHRQVFVDLRDKLLTVFAAGAASARQEIDELFEQTVEGIRFRE